MSRLENLDKKYILLGISVLSILVIIFYYYFDNKPIVIDGRLSSSDPKFKKALESQVYNTTELLNVVKEDDGISDDEYADNETNNRIVIPYKDTKSNKPLGILILEKANDKWVEFQDIKMIGESFDEIRLKDIDGDNDEEVIIGVSMSKNISKRVIVFKRTRSGYREVFTDNYEKLFIDSFGDEHLSLLVLTKKDPNTKTLSLNAYNFANENDIKTSKIILGDIDDKVSVKLGKISKDKSAFFIQKRVESNKGEISLFTLEEGTLQPIVVEGKEHILNSRYVDIQDKNGDKLIDIPVLTETNSGANLEEGVRPRITNWLSMDDDNSFKNIQREYTSEENEFTFKIPNSWGERLDVKERRREDSEKNVVMFDSYDSQENYSNMITIEIFSTIEWQRLTAEERAEMDVIFKTDTRIYILAKSSDGEKTDLESVKSNFKIFTPQ